MMMISKDEGNKNCRGKGKGKIKTNLETCIYSCNHNKKHHGRMSGI
ncbi:hypothetical protein [Candidatus Nitrososphaera evergladensis]|nr:hypothetical protein [Candidatus Nitrososphaera evergladensis]